MTKHTTGTRNEWLKARIDLLEAEKELTRQSDKLARRRQQLPWVRVDKDYRFDTDDGSASLKHLFRGRSQLLVYHFMFGPDYTAGCPSCSAIADGFDGFAIHLANHDVTLSAVSRAPLAKLQAYKRYGFDAAASASGPVRGHLRNRRDHVRARTYARGLDGLWGMYQWLDRAPMGRNEAGIWWRRHDEYTHA